MVREEMEERERERKRGGVGGGGKRGGEARQDREAGSKTKVGNVLYHTTERKVGV